MTLARKIAPLEPPLRPEHAAGVLIVDDVASLSRTYASYLSTEGVIVTTAATGGSALATLDRWQADVLVLDVNLPDMSGLDVLKALRKRNIGAEVIVITSNGSVSLAVEAMRLGAFDFIVKPFTPERLRVTVRNALERRRLAEKVEVIRDHFTSDRFCDFIGNSLAMQVVFQSVRSAAKSKATVFVTGESGTGKELCATALHQLSPRSSKPFVALNCAAIPRDLLESEIFGHVKGSFTGATTDRLGAVLQANGGTLFLDEIGELELPFQAKLLRFLETGLVQRIGEDMPQPCDVRIVCATNRSPQEEVAAGRFREDLFYRLYVVPIEMPPLRERDGDILLIAQHILATFSVEDGKSFQGFTPDCEEMLLRYGWPGNVRELRNVIRKIVVLFDGPLVSVDMLPPEIQKPKLAMGGLRAVMRTELPPDALEQPQAPRTIVPLEDEIDRIIDHAISLCSGSIPRAAAALKISPSTIYRRLQSRTGRPAELALNQV